MFAYGAGECAPVDLVTGPGNIYTVAAKRLLKGVVGIDSEAGPTEIAILADDTADAAYVAADLISQAEHDPAGRQRAGHRPPNGWPTTSRPSSTSRSSRPATPSGSAPRSAGSSPASCWSTTSSRVSTWSTPTPPSTSRSRPPTPPRWRRGSATPAPIFVGPFAPVSLGDYCAGSNHVLPTAGCACHSSGLSVRAFRKAVHVVDYDRDALAEVADHVVTLAEAEDLPGPRRRRSRSGSQPMTPGSRCGRSCAALEPYGAPQLDVPVRLNVNENPYPPSPAVVADIERAVAEAARDAQPLPRPRVRRAARRRWPPTSGHGVTPAQVWAANGSNEVMLHLLQAFGGPGRTGAELRADVLDVSRVRPRHPHRLGGRPPRGGLHPRPRRTRCALVRARRPHVVLLPSPNNPTGTALPPEVIAALCDELVEGLVVVDEAYAEFRRAGTPSALELLPRHPQPRRHPHDEQGVRAGRGAGRLPRGGARDLRRAPRRPPALPPLGGDPGGRPGRAAARRRAARRGRRPARRARRDRRLAARRRASTVADSDANFVLFGTFRRPARGLAGAAGPRRADPRDRPGRLAAGLDRHRAPRWQRSRTHSPR